MIVARAAIQTIAAALPVQNLIPIAAADAVIAAAAILHPVVLAQAQLPAMRAAEAGRPDVIKAQAPAIVALDQDPGVVADQFDTIAAATGGDPGEAAQAGKGRHVELILCDGEIEDADHIAPRCRLRCRHKNIRPGAPGQLGPCGGCDQHILARAAIQPRRPQQQIVAGAAMLTRRGKGGEVIPQPGQPCAILAGGIDLQTVADLHGGQRRDRGQILPDPVFQRCPVQQAPVGQQLQQRQAAVATAGQHQHPAIDLHHVECGDLAKAGGQRIAEVIGHRQAAVGGHGYHGERAALTGAQHRPGLAMGGDRLQHAGPRHRQPLGGAKRVSPRQRTADGVDPVAGQPAHTGIGHQQDAGVADCQGLGLCMDRAPGGRRSGLGAGIGHPPAGQRTGAIQRHQQILS
ncbi:hypothetical protein TRIHO_40540 [Tritonibacter horizontis]|uniref:Uncharacterized protein n=1 Tax=Tritonibacter horizontis TaxID=1768241 RepID=A0A132BSA9_9RHOB|nr:hypothetical protein TRIHO_40540 [Tritonibacter horizontis]